ncbi:MAG TPA: UDP-glucose 4-epimerase GalE [Clostridiales bacterium]|nr:UDP-glucose 4-epimerase GalE [Clostridiales bacterium]
MPTVLVTGGMGFIGSHTCIALDKNGFDVIIVDNLSNSKTEVLNRLKTITGKAFKFYKADCCDKEAMRKVFLENKIDSVIHFAGLKAVGESVKIPIDYYRNNINSMLTVLELMLENDVHDLVFSSSATVYGMSEDVPFTEESPLGTCTNPYGWTKWMLEQILKDCANAYPGLKIALLRYFNPVGAHESGLIGEDPRGIPNNLFPYISKVAAGTLEKLTVFGDDYDTPDGTCLRDYIHVMDLAEGHVKALNYIATKEPSVSVFNLGTGKGTSVKEAISAFEKACGHEIPYVIGPRRAGDIAVCYASTEKAEKELGFKAERTIDDMCSSCWKWQTANPAGLPDDKDE